MGWWLGSPVQRSDRSSLRHNHVIVSPVSCTAARFNPRVKVSSHKDRQYPAETGGQVRFDQCAGRRKISRKD